MLAIGKLFNRHKNWKTTWKLQVHPYAMMFLDVDQCVFFFIVQLLSMTSWRSASLEPGPSRARYFPRDMLLLTTARERAWYLLKISSSLIGWFDGVSPILGVSPACASALDAYDVSPSTTFPVVVSTPDCVVIFVYEPSSSFFNIVMFWIVIFLRNLVMLFWGEVCLKAVKCSTCTKKHSIFSSWPRRMLALDGAFFVDSPFHFICRLTQISAGKNNSGIVWNCSAVCRQVNPGLRCVERAFASFSRLQTAAKLCER